MCLRSLLVSVFLIHLSLTTAAGAFDTQPTSPKQLSPDEVRISNPLSSMPIAFTKNMGQWPDSILFRASGGGATMWFTRDGIYYQYFRRVERPESSEMREAANASGMPDKCGHERDSIETTMIKAEFVGSNPDVEVIGLDELEYRCNYFIGNDPDRWYTNVPNYSGFTLRGLYPGVDVRFRGKDGRMEYEVASVRSDYLAQVEVDYRGGERIEEQADGTILISTSLGPRLFSGIMPATFQVTTGLRSPIGSASPNALTLVYSTYLGGGSNEFGHDITVDGAGNAYLTGQTSSAVFPTQSPYQTVQGMLDVFVTKLSASGTSLMYSTYLGGTDQDLGRSIAVDASGDAYLTGETSSTDFPTQSPIQTDQISIDAFVTKLSASGSSLVYSTYLGGNRPDIGYDITVDGYGHAYLTGATYSTDFPTLSPYQTDPADGFEDVFVTKVSASGSSLVYSTYLGGNSADYGYGISVDGFGYAYLTGATLSTNFPTQSPYQTDRLSWDVFVTKLSASGSSLVYSTYLGGNYIDYGANIAVDGSGNAYVTGYTLSSDFPTQSPYQTDQGSDDAFVTKLSVSGASVVYSTYLGGGGGDYGLGIAVDGSGNAYVSGYTFSTNFPTQNPYQTDPADGFEDAFVTKVSASGSSVVYSTYLGGSATDYGFRIAVDGSGNAYVTGNTASTDFPLQSPYQTDQGVEDVFVTKFGDGGPDQLDQLKQLIIDIRDAELKYVDYNLCMASEYGAEGYMQIKTLKPDLFKKIKDAAIYDLATKVTLAQFKAEFSPKAENMGIFGDVLFVGKMLDKIVVTCQQLKLYGELNEEVEKYYNVEEHAEKPSLKYHISEVLSTSSNFPNTGNLQNLRNSIQVRAQNALASLPATLPTQYPLPTVINQLTNLRDALNRLTSDYNSGQGACTPFPGEREYSWYHPNVCERSDSNFALFGSTALMANQVFGLSNEMLRSSDTRATLVQSCQAWGAGVFTIKIALLLFGFASGGAGAVVTGPLGELVAYAFSVGCSAGQNLEYQGEVDLGFALVDQIAVMHSTWLQDTHDSYKLYSKVLNDLNRSFQSPSSCAGVVKIDGVEFPDPCWAKGQLYKVLSLSLRNDDPIIPASAMVTLKISVEGKDGLVGYFVNPAVSVPPSQVVPVDFHLPLPPASEMGGDYYVADMRIVCGQQSIAQTCSFPVVSCENSNPQWIAGECGIVNGYLVQGQSRSTESTMGPETVEACFLLSYSGSLVRLHLDDDQGRHVGVDSLTGLLENQIPGATFFGDSSTSQYITIPNSGSHTYTVTAVAESVPDSEYYSISLVRTPVRPAVQSIGIGSIHVRSYPSDTARFSAFVSEIGGQQALTNIAVTLTNLFDSTGNQVLPDSILDVQFPSSVPADSTYEILISGKIPALTKPGRFSGTLEVQSSGGSSNQAIELHVACCKSYTGNVNQSANELPDLSDLSLLISYLTTTPIPGLPCSEEANINSNGSIDLSDLSLLIAYLTVTPRPTLATCL